MKRIVVTFLMSLFGLAHADTSVSVGIGKTFGNTQQSGTWWQDRYPGGIDRTSPSGMLRVDETLSGNWSVGLGYAYIGNFNSDSQAVASDQAYKANTPYPLSRWIGNQHMDGIFFVGRYNSGSWYVEGGPIYERTSFSMSIPNWVPCADYPVCVVPDVAKTQALTVGNPKQMMWNITLGAGYKFSKKLALQFTEYPTFVRAPGGPGLLQMFSGNISFLYTF